MNRRLIPLLLLAWGLAAGEAQESPPVLQTASAGAPLASVDTKTPLKPGGLVPTWDTQKQARTYVLNIPAPRGQIVDRDGHPFAQTRVSYNLAINFPTPLSSTDAQVLAYAEPQILLARSITGRPISIGQDLLLKHYKNRGVL